LTEIYPAVEFKHTTGMTHLRTLRRSLLPDKNN